MRGCDSRKHPAAIQVLAQPAKLRIPYVPPMLSLDGRTREPAFLAVSYPASASANPREMPISKLPGPAVGPRSRNRLPAPLPAVSGGILAVGQAGLLGPFHSLALGLAIAVVLIIYSRLSEVLAAALGFNPYLVLLLSVSAFLLMIPTGGLARAFLAKPGILLTLFTVWLLFITPFSVWRGGSIELLKDYWSKSYMLYLILAGLIVSVGHCRKVLYAIAIAGMVVEIIAFRERVSSAERLLIGFGSFANPNDLAFYLLFSFPGCLLLILEGKPFSFRRLFGLASAVLVFLLAFQTGSRAALIMMIAVLAFLILTASFVNKAKILVAVIAVGVIAFATGGPGTILRYRTMFEDVAPQEADSLEVGKAVGSTQARKNLLKASLIMTMQNPLLGVGPGMFNVAASEDPYTARVLFAAWHETHNTFTQVSSETGIPGFLLYLGTMGSCFYIAIRVYRDTKRRLGMELHRKLAYCLLVACINYAVGGMFGSSAYNFFLPTLAGLSAALYRCYRVDLASLSVSQVPPQEPAYGFSRSKFASASSTRTWRHR